MGYIEEQEKLLQELSTKRYELWKERSLVDEKINDIDRSREKIAKDIAFEKSKSSMGFMGKFIKFENIYMLVKKMSNEYNNGVIAALAGPHFQLENDKNHAEFFMDSSDGDIDMYPPVMIKDVSEVEIISKEEYMDAYERCFNSSRITLMKAIDKPVEQ